MLPSPAGGAGDAQDRTPLPPLHAEEVEPAGEEEEEGSEADRAPPEDPLPPTSLNPTTTTRAPSLDFEGLHIHGHEPAALTYSLGTDAQGRLNALVATAEAYTRERMAPLFSQAPHAVPVDRLQPGDGLYRMLFAVMLEQLCLLWALAALQAEVLAVLAGAPVSGNALPILARAGILTPGMLPGSITDMLYALSFLLRQRLMYAETHLRTFGTPGIDVLAVIRGLRRVGPLAPQDPGAILFQQAAASARQEKKLQVPPPRSSPNRDQNGGGGNGGHKPNQHGRKWEKQQKDKKDKDGKDSTRADGAGAGK